MQSLMAERSKLIARAHSLKTKAAQRKAWDKVREVEERLEDLHETAWTKLVGTRIQGTAIMSGTSVLVETSIGTFEVNACNDALSKSWYNETCCVSYEAGQTVEFEIMVTGYTWRGAEVMAKNVTGGTFDLSRYEELASKPGLAFFKYPTGMTGLFSQRGA